MNKFLSIFFLGCLLLIACKKNPATSSHQHSLKSDSTMDWKPLSFNYLVIKSKISLKTKDNNNNLTANIRIKKDSLIWVSITPGMGIEVVRAAVTPDSIKIINRLDNKYDAYSITYIKQALGVDLDYFQLQNLIVGDILLPLSDEDQVVTSGQTWQINQQKTTLQVISLLSRIQKKVTEVNAQNADGRKIFVQYKDFILTDSVLFHQEQFMTIYDGKDTSFVEASHQKIEFPKRSVAFPFSVPKKYEKQ